MTLFETERNEKYLVIYNLLQIYSLCEVKIKLKSASLAVYVNATLQSISQKKYLDSTTRKTAQSL